jgi:hypothetical protein
VVSIYVRNDPLVIYQGDYRPFTWPLTNTDGSPLAIAGYRARAQVRAAQSSTEVLQEWSTENGRAVLSLGSVSLLVDDSPTWTWSVGVYDLHLIDSAGRHEVIAYGVIRVQAGVTR